jgi:hypothetical protein
MSAMNLRRRSVALFVFTPVIAMCLTLVVRAGQKDGKPAKEKEPEGKPKISLKAQPVISMSPSKVTFRVELVGGANDYEEFYCPTIEWDWGDGTQSESTNDCEPYERGKSEIRRRFTVDHVFRAGYYQVAFRLKKREKAIAMATTTVQVQGGANEFGR